MWYTNLLFVQVNQIAFKQQLARIIYKILYHYSQINALIKYRKLYITTFPEIFFYIY